jgi:16S rRNA (cytosine967-C5)-methyltransferase
VTTVRDVALEILLRAEQKAHAAPLLDARAPSMSSLDRDLLRSIVKGALRHQMRLDHVISRHLDRPLIKTDPAVRAALRAGAAQLLVLSRVPQHAAVSETVEAVRRRVPRAAGFVNAVLRKIAREEEPPGKVTLPSQASLADRLSLEYSHPRWLVKRWIARFGEETAKKILAADNEDSPVDLLVDPLSMGSREAALELLRGEGLVVEPSPWAPLAITVREGNPFSVPAVSSGVLAVVDAAAQGLLEVAPEVAIALDLAASPGGKTRTLLARGKARQVVAVEPQISRVRRLSENLGKGGLRKRVLVVAADGRRPPLQKGAFPLVILDAPCTGTGTLRKNPEKRYVLKREDFAEAAVLQRELLDSAVGLTVKGGTVIYITCSLEPEENEQVVRSTVSGRDDCEVLSINPEQLPFPLRPWIEPSGLLTVPPGRDNDGFSMALLRKNT